MHPKRQGWAIWLTGLPGSGKTTIAKELKKIFTQKGISVTHLQLDAIRKIITPSPKYTDEERDVVYRALVAIAMLLTQHGVNLIIDATAHKNVWRTLAKKHIKRFLEIYVSCPLETCIRRESLRKNNLVVRNIYKKALVRLKTGKSSSQLGQVIGIDVPYEVPSDPAFVVESDKISAKQAAEEIFKLFVRLI